MEALINLLLLGLALGLLVLVFTRGSSRARAVRQTQQSLKPGMQVMTGSGLFARIVEVEPEVVVLETAPGQTSRWNRQAIVRVIPDELDGTPDELDEIPDEPDEIPAPDEPGKP